MRSRITPRCQALLEVGVCALSYLYQRSAQQRAARAVVARQGHYQLLGLTKSWAAWQLPWEDACLAAMCTL